MILYENKNIQLNAYKKCYLYRNDIFNLNYLTYEKSTY